MVSGELHEMKVHRDSLAHEASARHSESDTARVSTSAYSKAVVASAKELHRQGQIIDRLKDELDSKDHELVRFLPLPRSH
jgi:hypothetical protein